MDEVLVKEQENSSEEEIIKTKEIIMDLDAYQKEQEELEKMINIDRKRIFRISTTDKSSSNKSIAYNFF